jgi:hypothetical protein
MTSAAGLAWVVTALIGLAMFGIWARRGGLRQLEEKPPATGAADRPEGLDVAPTRYSLALIGTHGLMGIVAVILFFGLAVIGFEDARHTGWFLIVWAAVQAVTGLKMYTGGTRETAAVLPEETDTAEDHLPRSLVLAHGLGAAAAVVLSVLLILEGI